MSDEGAVFDADAITIAPGQAPFQPVPLIRDILRTRFCIPASIFLVEGVEPIPVSASGRWQAVRLLLGDGNYCIQAMLSSHTHRFVETGEVSVGSYIRADSFSLAWERIGDEGAEKKHLVFLVLDDLTTVGWNDSYRNRWRAQRAAATEELAAEGDLDVEEANLEYNLLEADRAQMGMVDIDVVQEPVVQNQSAALQTATQDDQDVEDEFEAFEAAMLPPKKPYQQSKPSSLSKLASSSTKQGKQQQQQQPIALPRDWHDPQTPLKLTTLRSLPYLPYKQNWSCNILAIVTSLSAVEPSKVPPYKQRTARIADPSTAKRVVLTVFLDPDEFEPAVGSAVLLVGVKNHHFDGGSLKKYASDAKYGRWWFEDPLELEWCDVEGIKKWWAEVQESAAS
ncbi:hypothetical protein HJFPF1_03953 [Paramyrothecium foliicola]|nr:hypothetical protein HJFPF1_03953 [Paramyrothecium foliicola]